MSRENAVPVSRRVFSVLFQSAPGSMSRENRRIRQHTEPGQAVSIRSRLDEPGELGRLECLDRGRQMFQSAPGSMSRENSKPPLNCCRKGMFQSAPGSMSRENEG